MAKQIAIGLVFLLCLSSVQSAFTATDPAFTYTTTQCPAATGKTAGGSRFIPSGAIVTTGLPAIDGVSYARRAATDVGNDAVEIRYALSGTSAPWVLTFTTSFAAGSGPFTRTTPDITGDTAPVLLFAQKNVFVFQRGNAATRERVAYFIDTTQDVANSVTTNIFVLDLPLGAGNYPLASSITTFKVLDIDVGQASPYVTCYVEGALDAGNFYADFFHYAINTGQTTVSITRPNTVYGTDAANKLVRPLSAANLQGVGQPELFFDRLVTGANNGVVAFVSGAYVRVPTATFAVPNPTTTLIRSFRLVSYSSATNRINVLTFLDSATRLNLVLAYATFPTATAFTLADNSKTEVGALPWKIHSDRLQHLLLVSSDKIVWFYSGKLTGATIIAQPAQTGAYLNDDSNLYTANQGSVTFSGQLAFALTAGKITLYKVISNSQVDLYAVFSLTGNILAATVPSQQAITITCQCSAIAVRRFTCFSSTLACTTTVNVAWSTCV